MYKFRLIPGAKWFLFFGGTQIEHYKKEKQAVFLLLLLLFILFNRLFFLLIFLFLFIFMCFSSFLLFCSAFLFHILLILKTSNSAPSQNDWIGKFMEISLCVWKMHLNIKKKSFFYIICQSEKNRSFMDNNFPSIFPIKEKLFAFQILFSVLFFLILPPAVFSEAK